MRVLTFNSHQPYIHLLATSLPWTIGVVLPRLPSGKVKSWDSRIRPLPDNVRLYASLNDAFKGSSWDWALAHNLHDLIDCRALRLPKVFLVHGTLSGRILQDRSTIDRAGYLGNLRLLLEADRCAVVYISRLKQEDWGIPGIVIRSAVDPSHYGGYHGAQSGILQVCNHLRARGEMLGWESHRTVCLGLPTLVLGENRGLSGSRVAECWDDLKDQYRSWRVYLFTAVFPHEDGYNLALLEAMATGMPIATVAHPTSPVRDGVEGIVGATAVELRERVIRLLSDPEEACRMGRLARATLEKEFPISQFRDSWQHLAKDLIRGAKM